jgi:hypothetical protein
MTPYTKENLHTEIHNYMRAFAECLERVYFNGAGWGLVGLDSKDHLAIALDELRPEDMDVNKFYITQRLDELYEYGVNGRRHVDFDWDPDDDDSAYFLEGLEHFPLMYKNAINAISIAYSRHTVGMARVRWILDEGIGIATNEEGAWMRGGVLTLGDVALLANMDEKSVRNAANPKHKNYLKTLSYGSRTYVDIEDAKTWLKQRRGFRPTVIVDTAAERDLTRIGFFSEQDFGSYLTAQREKKGVSLADVVNAICDSDLTEEKLTVLEQGHFTFHQAPFLALAQFYQLDSRAFVLAGLALHQKLERERIEEQINTQIQA